MAKRDGEDYLETAKLLREHAPTMKSREARDGLRAVAQEYERLARFAESSKRMKPRVRA